jgi:hypothetical protein
LVLLAGAFFASGFFRCWGDLLRRVRGQSVDGFSDATHTSRAVLELCDRLEFVEKGATPAKLFQVSASRDACQLGEFLLAGN